MLYLSECIPRSATGMSADRAAAKSGHSLKPTDIEGAAAESDSGPNEDFSIDPMCTNCPNLAPKGCYLKKYQKTDISRHIKFGGKGEERRKFSRA
nr:RNA pseudouridine synthase 7 [Ipomoea batatas]